MLIPVEPSPAQETKWVSPGMSGAEVEAILGAPARVRAFGNYTYFFYDNACEECGMSDLVVLHEGHVIDAIFRAPDRMYTGQSLLPGQVAPARDGAAQPPPISEPQAPEAAPAAEAERRRESVVRSGQMVSSGVATHVPKEAAQLVVLVLSYFEGSDVEELGAGIIIGADGEHLYIATADHVLRHQGNEAIEIRVAFEPQPQDLVLAQLERAHDELDLAVISVPRRFVRAFEDALPGFDRRGNVKSLKGGDPVTPMGCPNGQCWVPPVAPDRIFASGRYAISFETFSVTRGSSGGGLFNEWWEVVGLVTEREGQVARAEAIAVTTVSETAESWGIPVGLRKPAIPRGGYRTSLGVMVLTSTESAESPYGTGRVPGARATLSHRLVPMVSVHGGLLRLAPENLSITGGVLGAALHLKTGRFLFRLFGEGGYGHAEGRFDSGGVYSTVGEGSVYSPDWVRVESDGVGGGAGIAIEVTALPRTIIEVLAAHWAFETPDKAPRLPAVFFGGGLRIGL